MSKVEEAARSALEPIASTMASDGYALTVSEIPSGVLDVRIEALEGACEDCLVPKSVMVPMIESLLADGGVRPTHVSVAYPTESDTH